MGSDVGRQGLHGFTTRARFCTRVLDHVNGPFGSPKWVQFEWVVWVSGEQIRGPGPPRCGPPDGVRSSIGFFYSSDLACLWLLSVPNYYT